MERPHKLAPTVGLPRRAWSCSAISASWNHVSRIAASRSMPAGRCTASWNTSAVGTFRHPAQLIRRRLVTVQLRRPVSPSGTSSPQRFRSAADLLRSLNSAGGPRPRGTESRSHSRRSSRCLRHSAASLAGSPWPCVEFRVIVSSGPNPSCGRWIGFAKRSPSSARMCRGCCARRGRSSLRLAVVSRIVNFVALGRAQDSKALAEALAKDEALVASLEAEVEGLQSASDSRVRFPSRPWVEKRLAALRELLERRTESSALVLRRRLGRMVLKPVYPEQGKPYYVARTAIDMLVLLEPPGSDRGSDPGASSFGWWTRNERTRTLAALPLEEVLRKTDPAPAS